MNIQDMSNEFDVLLNSYATKTKFGSQDGIGDIRLNEHEKSVFLTKAQEEIMLSLYTGKNPYGESFEQTEELRRYLSSLVEEKSIDPIETSDGKPLGIESFSKFFTLPDNCWFITYEGIAISDDKCGDGSNIEVVPVKQDEYRKLRKNPFRGANDRRALRFDLSDGVIEIVSKYTVTKYYIRYLKKLTPIILAPLDTEASIDGKTDITGCELHESLHHKILERAVVLALQSKGYNVNSENK